MLSGCPLVLHSSSTTSHVLPRLKNLSDDDEWELADRAAFKAVQDQPIAASAVFLSWSPCDFGFKLLHEYVSGSFRVWGAEF